MNWIWIGGEADMLRLIQDFRSVERSTTIYAAMCVILLMVCTSITMQNLLERMSPSWNLGYLPWLSGLVAVEALISQQRMIRKSELETNPVIYRLVELVIITVITRLACLPWGSGRDILGTLAGWGADFLTNFFDGQFLLSILAIILVWGLSSLYGQDLLSMEGDELALDAGSLDGLVSDRAAAQRRLVERVFAVGGGMVFINGLLRQEIIDIFSPGSSPNQDAWHVVVYFVIGLALLSLAQLANRRLAWAWERIPVKSEIARRWIETSLIFLVLVVIFALLLPTGYTIGFMPAFSYIVGMVIYFLFGIVVLILTPVFYVFSWLMSLFHVEVTDRPIEMIQRPVLDQTETLIQAGQPGWWELVRSVLFWVVLLGVVGYAVVIYFRQNKELTNRVQRVKGFRWLTKAWAWLVCRLKTGAERAPQFVRGGIDRLRVAFRRQIKDEPIRYLSLRRLGPRQKALFYYQTLLRRASEAEQPRAAWQTPREYENYLSIRWPEIGTELDSLTESFIEARYSQHEVTEDQISIVRQAWDQVRKYLRNRQGGG
jgi:hypothetical protein